jgi:hypothetical protein
MNLLCIGNIAYWSTLVTKAEIVLEIQHTFQKQSELSQYDITTANGRLKLSIPTQKSTRKGAYSDVRLDYSTNWQTEHWRSIENAYLKSPFYLYYGYNIEKVYKHKHETLVELNTALLTTLLSCIKLNQPVTINQSNAVYYSPSKAVHNKKYPQVYDTKIKFEENLSILDVLFNLGPETGDYLLGCLDV